MTDQLLFPLLKVVTVIFETRNFAKSSSSVGLPYSRLTTILVGFSQGIQCLISILFVYGFSETLKSELKNPGGLEGRSSLPSF
jgi:hypothetical protein